MYPCKCSYNNTSYISSQIACLYLYYLIPCVHHYILYLAYYIVYKLPYGKLIYQSRYTIYVFNY